MGHPKKSPIFLDFPTLSLSFLLFLAAFLPHSVYSQTSIYDHLRLNGLPVGLLPDNITEYSLDPTTGYFQINLTQPCNAKFENELHYDFNISGSLSFGKIGDLFGVSQQDLFLWFPVKSIRVDAPGSGLIHFDVGVVDKQFSLSMFENHLECTAADPIDGAIYSPELDGSKDGVKGWGTHTSFNITGKSWQKSSHFGQFHCPNSSTVIDFSA